MTIFLRFLLNSFLLTTFFISCSTRDILLSDIPNEDSQAIFYFRNGLVPGDGGEFASRTIRDAQTTSMIALQANGTTVSTEPTGLLEPSISSDGKYFIFPRKAAHNNASTRLEENQIFTLYNREKKSFILEETTKVPCLSDGALYTLPWSYVHHSFYTVKGNAITKCLPDGKTLTLCSIENLRSFSVSPSERWLLFAQDDRVGVVDLETRDVVRIREFDDLLGLTVERCLRSIAWSPDENKVAYSHGKRFGIFDLPGNENIGRKIGSDIYALEWLTNDVLVFVEGYEPNPRALLNIEPYYGIHSYTISTNEVTVLHRRENHEPLSVKPQRSPSGKFFLFAEKEFNEGYSVKLMSMEGELFTVCKGYNPLWTK